MREVSFGDFALLTKKRVWTIDQLVGIFGRQIEDPRDFFERVLSCRWHGENRSEVIIPYRSVIEFYEAEIGYQQDSEGVEKRCKCGCGLRIIGPRAYATDACKQKTYRSKNNVTAK